jgi:hypothetical protein
MPNHCLGLIYALFVVLGTNICTVIVLETNLFTVVVHFVVDGRTIYGFVHLMKYSTYGLTMLYEECDFLIISHFCKIYYYYVCQSLIELCV